MRNRYPPMKAYPVKGFGGLDTVTPPELVAANRFTDLIDFRTENNGMLEFRERVTYYAMNAGVRPISFLTVARGNNSSIGDAILYASGRGAATNNYGGIYVGKENDLRLVSRAPSSAATSLALMNSNYPTSGAFFRNHFVAANEFTPLYPLPLDTPNANQRYEGVIGRFVFSWRQRLYVFNTTRDGCELLASSILVGDRFMLTTEFTPYAGDFYEVLGAKRITVSNDSSEYGTGAVIWNEVPILATNKGLYRVDSSNFGVFPITKETGVVEKTLCIYRNNVFFLGEDDVYVMDSLSSVKPLTKNTVHNSIFSGDYITRDTLQQNEYIVDTYLDWNSYTQIPAAYVGGFTWSVGPAAPQNTQIIQGGYINVAGALPAPGNSTYGDRELTAPLPLSSLYPDYGGAGGVKEHLSNFIRLDFIMENTWDEMNFFGLGGTSDSQYARATGTIQFYLATRQGSSVANCLAATYSEILPNSSGYNRDNRILSFVVPITPQANANIFDWYFQFALRLRHYQDAGALYTSNPQVHRVRLSWLSAVEQGSGYLDLRQQPYMCAAKDKLWLHLSGKTTSDDSMSFVMDSRGEWTKYRNFDAFSMIEVDARHEVNDTIHRRFLVGTRWQRYSGVSLSPFYIETEEWDDFLADPNQDSSGDDYDGAIAVSPRLIFEDLSQFKRLRYIQLFYEGSYDDLVTLYLWSSGYSSAPYPSVSLPHNSISTERMIDTIRHSANFGSWFSNKITLLGPIPLSQKFNLSQIMYYIQTLTTRPSVGQPAF